MRKPKTIAEMDYHNKNFARKDFIFYTHKKEDKRIHQEYRCSCNVCGKKINCYGLAKISISNGNQQYRLLGNICKEDFPKLCKVLKMDVPDFTEPYFTEDDITTKKYNSVICYNCEKTCNTSFNYCPKCGMELEK